MFSNLHSSLAPPKPKSSSESLYGSAENLSSSGSSPALSEKKWRAPMAPGYAAYRAHAEISNSRGVSAAGHSSVSVRENPLYDESDGSKNVKRPPLPLPDYDTLFPQKRHGVQGQTKWDHIIAEVNQKQRDNQAEFCGQEMSVDEPEKPTPRQSSLEKHKPPTHVQQTQLAETKPISSKKVPAPAPPKTVAATHSRPMADSNQKQSQSVARAFPSVERTNASAVPVSVNTDATKRESVVSRDGAKKALQPPVTAANHRNMQPIMTVPTPINQRNWDKRPTVVQKELPDTINKEIPTTKARQKVEGIESITQADLDTTSLVSVHNIKGINRLSHSDGNKLDKIIMEATEKFEETDPFPSSDELISKDPWAQVDENPVVDNLFTGKAQKEQKPEDKGMMADDIDKLFAPLNSTDPFNSFNAKDSEKTLKNGNQEFVPSQKRKLFPASPVYSTIADIKGKQEPALDEDAAIVFPNLSDKEANISASQALQPKADVRTRSRNTEHWREPQQVETQFREDPFVADPFTVGSSSSMPFVMTPAELQQVTMEESVSQSGGRTPLRAWVSPSEGQPVSVQNSNGGGLTSTPRRPHPVKPMSSVENLSSTSIPAVREIKIHDGKAAQMKAADSVESGPYTQLTQEELITLVVKQQVELSKKDSKITELEEYIDNLLVRVIEEKPSILLALTSGKPT